MWSSKSVIGYIFLLVGCLNIRIQAVLAAICTPGINTVHCVSDTGITYKPSDSGFCWFTCEVLRGQPLRQWLLLVHLLSTTETAPQTVGSSGSLVKYYGDSPSNSGFFWFTCEVLRGQPLRQWFLLVHL